MEKIKKSLQLLSEYKTKQLVLAFAIFWAPILLFAKIANEIVEKEPIKLDSATLHWLHAQSSAMLDVVFLIFTTMGNVVCIVPVTLLIAAWLIYKRHKQSAAIVLIGVGGGAIANFLLKLIFQRERPAFWQSIVSETSYPFPSGHAMISSALYIAVVCALWKTRWRWPAIIIGGVVVVMIGLSRLYFGVHYPTDIVAGWCVSAIWLTIVIFIVRGVRLKKKSQA